MYAVSSAFVDGYTVVVAPAAHITAKSAKTHSYRVAEAIPTRCSGSRPSDSRPAANRETCSPASAHVTDVQRSPPASMTG